MIVYDNSIYRMEVFMKSYKQMTKEELLTIKAELEKRLEADSDDFIEDIHDPCLRFQR